MRYFLAIVILMLLPCVNRAQARPLFDGHKRQDRPIQRKPPNRDKVAGPERMAKIADRLSRAKMAKSAYITRQLDLTPAQNEKFWPLYNKYQDEVLAVQFEKRINNSANQANGLEQLTRARALDRKMADVKDRYQVEFLKILPPEKVSLIYKSEQQFQDEMIKQRMEKKEEANN